jgi:uncharacterized protein (UPF0210 family)
MHFTPVVIRETVDMLLGHKLDIRAITLGVSRLDCAASLSLDKLEAKTTVCSVGLDMIVLPGAPIMPLHPFSSDAFIARGGRIPAPITSFRN